MILIFEENETKFDSLGLGVLRDAVSCSVKEGLNDEYTLEMTYPITGSNFDKLLENRIILAKPNMDDEAQPFRIHSISRPINGVVTVDAYHISYDMNGIPVSGFKAGNFLDAVNKIASSCVGDCPFKFVNAHAVDKKFYKTFEFSAPTNLKALLSADEDSIGEVYDVEYKYDKWTVTLYGHRGADRGLEIRYAKNLQDVTQDTSTETLYSHVYPFYHKETTSTTSNSSDDGFPKVYIVGNKPFQDGWFSYQDGGEPFHPVDSSGIQVATEGNYKDKIYSWNEGDQRYEEKIYNQSVTLIEGVTDPKWIKINWSGFPTVSCTAATDGYFKTLTSTDGWKFHKSGDVIFDGKVTDLSNVSSNMIIYFSEVIPPSEVSTTSETTKVVHVELDDKLLPIDTDEAKRMKHKSVYLMDLTSEFNEEPTKEKLRDKANELIKKNKLGKLKKTTDVKFVDLRRTTDSENLKVLKDVQLGDTVKVIYTDLGINESLRVISTTYNVITNSFDNIELGEKKDKFSDNSVQNGDSISSLSNDAGYTDEDRVSQIIAETVTADYIQAQNAKLSKAQIDDLSVQRIKCTGILEATQFEIDKLVSKMLVADNAEIAQTLTAGNIKVSGDIDVKSGQINITGDDGTVFNVDREGHVTANGMTITGGSIEIQNGENNTSFLVDKDGYLTANGARIYGTIVATAGEIGGCKIVDGKLQIPAAQIGDSNGNNITQIINDTIQTSNVVAENLKVEGANVQNLVIGRSNLDSTVTSDLDAAAKRANEAADKVDNASTKYDKAEEAYSQAQQANEDAKANLSSAKSDLTDANAKLEQATSTYNDAVTKSESTISDAEGKYNQAVNDYNAAIANLYNKLTEGQQGAANLVEERLRLAKLQGNKEVKGYIIDNEGIRSFSDRYKKDTEDGKHKANDPIDNYNSLTTKEKSGVYMSEKGIRLGELPSINPGDYDPTDFFTLDKGVLPAGVNNEVSGLQTGTTDNPQKYTIYFDITGLTNKPTLYVRNSDGADLLLVNSGDPDSFNSHSSAYEKKDFFGEFVCPANGKVILYYESDSDSAKICNVRIYKYIPKGFIVTSTGAIIATEGYIGGATIHNGVLTIGGGNLDSEYKDSVNSSIQEAVKDKATTEDVKKAIADKATTEDVKKAVSDKATTKYVDDSVSDKATKKYVDDSVADVTGKVEDKVSIKDITDEIGKTSSELYTGIVKIANGQITADKISTIDIIAKQGTIGGFVLGAVNKDKPSETGYLISGSIKRDSDGNPVLNDKGNFTYDIGTPGSKDVAMITGYSSGISGNNINGSGDGSEKTNWLLTLGENFGVDANGNLFGNNAHLSSADISGKIVSSEGTIAGLTLSNQAMYAPSTFNSINASDTIENGAYTTNGFYIGTDGIRIGVNAKEYIGEYSANNGTTTYNFGPSNVGDETTQKSFGGLQIDEKGNIYIANGHYHGEIFPTNDWIQYSKYYKSENINDKGSGVVRVPAIVTTNEAKNLNNKDSADTYYNGCVTIGFQNIDKNGNLKSSIFGIKGANEARYDLSEIYSKITNFASEYVRTTREIAEISLDHDIQRYELQNKLLPYIIYIHSHEMLEDYWWKVGNYSNIKGIFVTESYDTSGTTKNAFSNSSGNYGEYGGLGGGYHYSTIGACKNSNGDVWIYNDGGDTYIWVMIVCTR